jgi:hypothetical protein
VSASEDGYTLFGREYTVRRLTIQVRASHADPSFQQDVNPLSVDFSETFVMVDSAAWSAPRLKGYLEIEAYPSYEVYFGSGGVGFPEAPQVLGIPIGLAIPVSVQINIPTTLRLSPLPGGRRP